MGGTNSKVSEFSVFKGRGKKLNRAIFQILGLYGPQKKYRLYKNLIKFKKLKKRHYGNVNKRVNALKQSGFLEEIDLQTIEAGSEAVIYELKPKAYLAMLLDGASLENMISRLDDDSITEILAVILASQMVPNSSKKQKP